ncbi:hypothetical protein QF028_004413 [Neobacillus sp. B4I6]
MNKQELKDEIQLLKDMLFFSERARDGHYCKLQLALKRVEELEEKEGQS